MIRQDGVPQVVYVNQASGVANHQHGCRDDTDEPIAQTFKHLDSKAFWIASYVSGVVFYPSAASLSEWSGMEIGKTAISSSSSSSSS